MTAQHRADLAERLAGPIFDTLIIGAGINGAVTAGALTARGLNVALVDRGDFASFTSQESSNLVWGGFKYLQTYEFGLVRKLSKARNRLIDAFPSSVTPIDFLAVFDDQAPFPPWLASLGSFAYWGIGSFAGKPPKPLTSAQIGELEPAIELHSVRGGLRYSDALLEDNDARFVFNFVRRAVLGGATAANYVEVTAAEWTGEHWEVSLLDLDTNETIAARARSIINATGPFLDRVNDMLKVETQHAIALSKGIHLIVPRIGNGEQVLAFFDEDERLYYVIPMDDRSVIGTTDTKVNSPHTEVTDEDRDFVLRQVNARLVESEHVTRDDIIAERSGVRPLVVQADDGQDPDAKQDWLQLSRKHEIEIDQERKVVSIFGGKLTDCLNVGEEVAKILEQHGVALAAEDESWFGEGSPAERSAFESLARSRGVAVDYADLLWRRYDRDANNVLDEIAADPALVVENPPYSVGELRWVGNSELVVTVQDFLRRRSSIALTTEPAELAELTPKIEVALGLFGSDHRS